MHSALPPMLLALFLGSSSPTPKAQNTGGAGQTLGESGTPRALFLEQCASCHGERGDGQGWTQLERPARSFQDGGFSYGNTPEAIFRTLTTGIPGTPMPSFDGSLSQAQRRALADYVITLGPPATLVERADTIAVVADRPRLVRGMLPPIATGAQPRVRGLLIGMPSGITFEYRVDDVRLLGLRQGDFCERTDWVGRGGTELRPLGQVVHLMEGGSPRPSFHENGEPLQAHLRGTWTAGGDAGVRYRLVDAAGETAAEVEEGVRSVSAAFGTGFERTFRIERAPGRGLLTFRARHPGAGRLIGWLTKAQGARRWAVLQREDGFVECLGFPAALTEEAVTSSIDLVLAADGSWPLTTIVCPAWNAEVGLGLEELSR